MYNQKLILVFLGILFHIKPISYRFPDFSFIGLIESAKKLRRLFGLKNTTTIKIPGFCFQIFPTIFENQDQTIH